MVTAKDTSGTRHGGQDLPEVPEPTDPEHSHAIEIGRRTVQVALTAIWLGVAISIALMVVAMTGVIPAVVGALIQELVDLATILYALRALSGELTPVRTLMPPSDGRHGPSVPEHPRAASG